MKRVIGLGGIFFKCKDPENLRAWYKKHLGIDSETWGAMFPLNDKAFEGREGYLVWSPAKADSSYFEPSSKEYMVNFRVADLEGLVAELKKEGVELVGDMQSGEFGKFAWVIDPEGTKLELWEPPSE